MSDLLKEAIADAKAVRETALQNAKMALEEAFTPHLKSMLSAKLSEDDVEEGYHDREDDDEDMDEMGSPRPPREDDDEEKDEGMHDSDRPREEDDEEETDEGMHDDEDEEEAKEEGIIEIDGVKYARLEGEHEDEEDDVDESEELDLESVITELETEIAESEELEEGEDDSDRQPREDDDDEKKDEPVDEEIVVEEDEEDLEEQSKSSEIGSGDNKVDSADASDEEDPGNSTDVEALGEQLKEYKQAVKFLKDKLHEVNILNAKLLFTNKLFKEFALDNNQKLKVVETFDRTQSTREIKLVYSTLCEQFSDNSSIKNKKSINESASSKSGSTKPSQKSRKVITEEDNVAKRFKKLAGIING